MKVEIRKELNVDVPVNLRRLSPFMKLYAGFMVKVHESKWYQTNKHKKEEQAHALQVKQDERLKDALLAIMYRELVDNKTLRDRDDVCQEITIAVDSRHVKSLDRIINHKDFIIYDIQRISENPDLRKAFPTMQVLLRVSKKAV